MSDSPLAASHGDVHNPALRHHFADMEQQRESAELGMWLFLITEVMFFGGMFCAYMVYRYMYYQAWEAGSEQMDFWYGTINTHGAHLQQSHHGAWQCAPRRSDSGRLGHVPDRHHAVRLRVHGDQGRRVLRALERASVSRRRTFISTVPTRNTCRFSSFSTGP